ncbi:hypothetical protein [Candidatus Pseudomonas adelgestsugas]|nr:hypothetical protein [Candidatus Pseudomonas adelgestsugas]
MLASFTLATPDLCKHIDQHGHDYVGLDDVYVLVAYNKVNLTKIATLVIC